MTSGATIEPVPGAAAGALLEGPVWDDHRQRLLWVDIRRGNLHWLDPGWQASARVRVGETVGFVSLTSAPDHVVVGRDAGLTVLHLPSGRRRRLLELETTSSGLRCNDGKCDPTGRLWVGTTSSDEEPRPGVLYSIDRDLHVQRHLENVACSNGLAWDSDRGAFLFIDSLTRRLDRYTWDPVTGRIGGRRTLCQFSDGDGLPDGMTRDREGHLWIAFWSGACVRRIHHETGASLTQIDLPTPLVSACTFGGANLAALFITTASPTPGAMAAGAETAAGRLYHVDPHATGQPADRFPLSPSLLP